MASLMWRTDFSSTGLSSIGLPKNKYNIVSFHTLYNDSLYYDMEFSILLHVIVRNFISIPKIDKIVNVTSKQIHLKMSLEEIESGR